MVGRPPSEGAELLTFRHVREDEEDAFRDCLSVVYSFDRDTLHEEHIEKIFEKDRYIGAFDGETLVGTLGTFSLDMAVPGGSMPTAGTTIVSVLPTHRRRGALRGMMEAHFAEISERGEPLAALWSSEMPIYGRFGFGWAADRVEVKLDTRHATFRELPADVTIKLVDGDQAAKILPTVYDQVWSERPGMFARSPNWWEFRRLRDLPERRNGATAFRFAIAERHGHPVGYLLFRTKEDWSSGHGAGSVQMVELITLDTPAEVALWQFACGIDLAQTLSHDNRPVDDPMLWNLDDPRRLDRKVSDSLWVRVMNVESALSGREYAADGDLILEIDDPFQPERGGTFALSAVAGVASCTRTEAMADVTMPARVLGAVYLGGKSLRALVAAGAAAGDRDALRLFDQMFEWSPRPWCQEVF